MSISRAQASALAEGFLDNIGSETEFQPRETFTDLILMAGEFIEDAQDNLNKRANNATGNLSESLEAAEPERTGGELKVDVYMNFYGKFQNKGVKGTRSGSGFYEFKHDMPSVKMVEAIQKWIKDAKVKTTNVKQGYGKGEIKNKKISAYSNAFGVARGIKMYGIKKTSFLDDAVKTTSAKVQDRLGVALKIDIINSITKQGA